MIGSPKIEPQSPWVRKRGSEVEVHYGLERIAVHNQAPKVLIIDEMGYLPLDEMGAR